MILGALDGEPAQRLAGFYADALNSKVGLVDLVSLLLGMKVLELSSGINVLATVAPGWGAKVAEVFESLRREDGGYAKSEEGRAGSTYQTFLTLLGYQVLEREPPQPDRLADFLLRHEQAEGGFLEIRVGKRAGVNPTAAAIGALRILGRLEERVINNAREFLRELVTDEGGWAANTRIPLADVLSTFTALVTLHDLHGLDGLNLQRTRNYLLSMERPGGGFAGFALDPAEDIEYTFYAIGGLALLALK
jgi:geranylgeranyl transferase type-2 subunit beta